MKVGQIIGHIGRELKDVFSSAIEAVIGQDVTNETALKKTLRAEMNMLNQFAKQNDFPIKAKFNPNPLPNLPKDTLSVLLCVDQGMYAYPAERKIAFNIDMSSATTVYHGVEKMKESFVVECKRIDPRLPIHAFDLK